MIARQTVLTDLIEILKALTAEWETDLDIREDSCVLRDLGLESIDAVVLGGEITDKYQRSLPFAQFIAELQQRDQRDFAVGQLVDFVTRELNAERPAADAEG